jgi:hypothetical protein
MLAAFWLRLPAVGAAAAAVMQRAAAAVVVVRLAVFCVCLWRLRPEQR